MNIDTIKQTAWPKIHLLLISSLVFALAKAAVFIAPLLISNLSSTHIYGTFEYCLSFGTFLSTILSFGFGAAVPYFILERKKTWYRHVVVLHLFILTLTMLAYLLFAYLFSNHLTLTLTVLIATIIANQLIYSSFMKINSKTSFAAIIDSGLYIVLFAYSFALLLLNKTILLSHLTLILVGYLFLLSAVSYKHLPKVFSTRQLFSHYLRAVRYGIPTGLASMVMALVVSGGRLIVGTFGTMDNVAIYAFYLRLAMISIIVYQFLVIVLFKKVYTASAKELNAIIPAFMLLIFTISLCSYLILPHFIGNLFSIMKATYAQYHHIYFILSCQMALWAGIALTECIINRKNLASRFILHVALLVPFFLMFLMMLREFHYFTLVAFCYSHITMLMLVLLIQLNLLRKQNFKLPTVWITGVVILLVSFL